MFTALFRVNFCTVLLSPNLSPFLKAGRQAWSSKRSSNASLGVPYETASVACDFLKEIEVKY